MDIQRKRFLFLAQYAAPYEGNFIASLKALEESLIDKYACQVAYVFPEAAQRQAWMKGFSTGHRSFFTRDDVQHSQEDLRKIRTDFRPDVVHTHFDGYDVAAKQVFATTSTAGGNTRVVWHMHNHISFVHHPLKALYQMWAFLYHYGLQSRNVGIIAVSEDMRTLPTNGIGDACTHLPSSNAYPTALTSRGCSTNAQLSHYRPQVGGGV